MADATDDSVAPLQAMQHVQVERALIDVALLRTFVSSRNEITLDRAFAPGFPVPPPAEAPTKHAFLARLAEIERAGADAISRDPEATAFLFGARDTLNAVAAPADAYTIAFTGFYTGALPEAGVLRHRKDFAEMRTQARISKLVLGAMAAVGVVLVVLAVHLSVHATVGKTVLEQVARTDAALSAIDREIAVADVRALSSMEQKPGVWSATMPRLCDRMALMAGMASRPDSIVHGFEGPEHWLLCDRRREAKLRNDVAKSELATWIDATTGMTPRAVGREPARFGTAHASTGEDVARVEPQPQEPGFSFASWISWLPGLSVRDPSKHTQYTSEQVGWALIGALAVYYLPVLFGMLGGAVYAVRRLNQKILGSELHPRDWRHAVLRIFMAFLIGGCIGLFFRSDGTAIGDTGSEITLSIAALAFLAGYSVEVVFRFFDLLIGQAARLVSVVAPEGQAGGAAATAARA